MFTLAQPAIGSVTVIIPTSNGLEFADSASIVRIEAISNYSKIFFSNGKTMVVAKVLAWFEEKLAVTGFIRLHRSHLVNMQFIQKCRYDKSAAVVLKNSESITISKRRKQDFKRAVLQFYSYPAALRA